MKRNRKRILGLGCDLAAAVGIMLTAAGMDCLGRVLGLGPALMLLWLGGVLLVGGLFAAQIAAKIRR